MDGQERIRSLKALCDMILKTFETYPMSSEELLKIIDWDVT